MVDAFDAGLWLYWFAEKEIICVEQPSLHIADNRLHRENGPAVEWPGGEKYWFWKGLSVPQWIIETPTKITAKKIFAERNTEIRRVMIERFGYERYMPEAGGAIVHKDKVGKLWRTNQKRGLDIAADDIAVVEVVNGSKEPDGTYKRYFLSVPPTCRTATEAVAWSYGMTEAEYAGLKIRT